VMSSHSPVDSIQMKSDSSSSIPSWLIVSSPSSSMSNSKDSFHQQNNIIKISRDTTTVSVVEQLFDSQFHWEVSLGRLISGMTYKWK